QAHQLVGVMHFSGKATHAGRQVAAQRHDAADALSAVVVQDLGEFRTTRTDARQVRCRIVVQRLHQTDGVGRTVAGGAAGPVRDANVRWVAGHEHLGRYGQPLTRRRLTSRKEFQTDYSSGPQCASTSDSSLEIKLKKNVPDRAHLKPATKKPVRMEPANQITR